VPEYFYQYIHWNIMTCYITDGIIYQYNVYWFFIFFISSIIQLGITYDTNCIANPFNNLQWKFFIAISIEHYRHNIFRQ
jgi:hypothetical protein